MPKLTKEVADAFMRATMGEDYNKESPSPPLPQFSQFAHLPNFAGIQSLLTNPEIERDFHRSLESQGDRKSRLARAFALRAKGDSAFANKQWKNARDAYTEAATILAQGPIPHREGYVVLHYLELGMDMENVVAQMCCAQAARCMVELREYEDALQWSSEVDVLQRHAQYAAVPTNGVEFEWIDFYLNLAEYYQASILANFAAYDAYKALGNTGTAAERHWTGLCTWNNLSPLIRDTVRSRVPKPSMDPAGLLSIRHPDPFSVHKQTIISPNLQVRGSWSKLNVPGGPCARIATATFVYEGTFYVFGGEREAIGPYYTELWALDLEAKAKWRQLQSFPFPPKSIIAFSNYSMALNKKDSKAFLFLGSPDVPFFDLKTNTWGCIKTKYEGAAWPYTKTIKNYAMHCIDGSLYIFGGKHDGSRVGQDLFMTLDIEKKTWTKLSGTTKAEKPDFFSPGPREHPCSWVGKDRKKIYIFAGDADRLGAKMLKDLHASDTTYDYEDLWSWDIATKKWKKERIIGNRPCKRTEMACVYNPILDKVFTFGGYSPRVPTITDNRTMFHFSYYGDTFMLDSDDPTKSSWKHVVTRGFPTYRAHSQLVVDETTGKTYLFSGYTNSDFVPSRNSPISRNFADVWQLKLDVPGGFFDNVDLEEEARTAKAGPWQRCYTCGSAGPWQKCGGSCSGKAFFCNHTCFREGWRDHKERHKCRKK